MTKNEILMLGKHDLLINSLMDILINKNLITKEDILDEIKKKSDTKEHLEPLYNLLEID